MTLFLLHVMIQDLPQCRREGGDRSDRIHDFMAQHAAQIGEVEFDRSQFRLTASGMIQLDFAGRILRENPQLSLAVASPPRKKNNSETENNSETVDERFQAIAEYLETRWQIAPDRIKQSVEPETENKTLIKFE